MAKTVFRHGDLKRRMANAGSPIMGWSFLTEEEKKRLKAKAKKSQLLSRDSGRADAKLKKF